MGERGLLFITKTGLIYRPLEPNEHAFVIPRSNFVEAKVSVDSKFPYLTIKSKLRKNQEFSIQCDGTVREAGFNFPNVLNYVTRIANDFDLGLAEFKKQIAGINSTSGRPELKAEDNTINRQEPIRKTEAFQIAEQEIFGLLNQADSVAFNEQPPKRSARPLFTVRFRSPPPTTT